MIILVSRHDRLLVVDLSTYLKQRSLFSTKCREDLLLRPHLLGSSFFMSGRGTHTLLFSTSCIWSKNDRMGFNLFWKLVIGLRMRLKSGHCLTAFMKLSIFLHPAATRPIPEKNIHMITILHK